MTTHELFFEVTQGSVIHRYRILFILFMPGVDTPPATWETRQTWVAEFSEIRSIIRY